MLRLELDHAASRPIFFLDAKRFRVAERQRLPKRSRI